MNPSFPGSDAIPPFWQWTGFWTAAFLLLVASFVPGGARMPGLEDRRARVGRLMRFALAAWLLFHLWGVLRLVHCLQDLRVLGPKGGSRDVALGIVRVGQTVFGGWACLAGTVVLSGIVLRGAGGKQWRPPLLLIGFAGAVLYGVLWQHSEPADDPAQGYYHVGGWEIHQGPLILLSIPAAAIVCIRACYGLWRNSRAPDPQRRERERLRLAGAGIVLLGAGVLFALARGFLLAQNVIILGPKLNSRDLQALPGEFVLPGAVILFGILPTVFGVLHLAPRREDREPGAAPGPGGDGPAP